MTEPSAAGVADPGPATPDDSDWTWVLSRPCPDCGFDATAQTGATSRRYCVTQRARYAVRLAEPDARIRPSAGVWSPLEYSCHVRDVCDVMRGRLERILDGSGEQVQFANWDQDETAVSSSTGAPTPRSSSASSPLPRVGRGGILRPVGDEWEWPALRSNGSRFTARTLAFYFVHDVRHHLWDVKA